MSYNTDLQSNNEELAEILRTVNALPEAGSGDVAEPVVQPLEVTENGTYTAPEGVDGYSPVTVNVPVPDGYIIPSGSVTITENGEYDVTDKAGVVVQVETGGGSGGSVETCTVNIVDVYSMLIFNEPIVCYTDANSAYQKITITGDTVLTVLKNTIVVFIGATSSWEISDSGERLFHGSPVDYGAPGTAYLISGDCEILAND